MAKSMARGTLALLTSQLLSIGAVGVFGAETVFCDVDAEGSCRVEAQQQQQQEDASLLQKTHGRIRRHFDIQKYTPETCNFEDHVPCPGSGNMCSGNQCCPPIDDKGTFPCPSAESGWGRGFCNSEVKVEDCVGEKQPVEANPFSGMAGKSIYFVPVDRFARDRGASTEACENDNHWCNGTLRGLTRELSYIQDMGFDCIWITPVVEQWQGESPSGTGCMGYWANNLYEIDPHFGTKQDMKDLVAALHERDMCLVYDFVANHMGPIHNTQMVREMVPFNKPEHFHQLFIGDMSFDEYTAKTSNWPPPAQAMWSQSGAQCTQGISCSCYKCVKTDDLGILADPFGDCDGEMVFDEDSPCPEGALSPYCMPGDYACEGYNETITQQGWFYDLGDLNQSDPWVKKQELDWIKWFVKEYGIDNLRLDTAPFMTFEFLSDLQEAAGVPIIGEVTTTNLTFHANFQRDPPVRGGQDVLDAVLNFPTYYTALGAFCGKWFPFSTYNMTFLGERMEQQMAAPYKSLNNLGNFIDNHDTERIAKSCRGDVSRIKGSLAWVMMAQGIPIIYYGTEQMFDETRKSLWQTRFSLETELAEWITQLNRLRKRFEIGVSDMTVLKTRSMSHLALIRYGKRPVLILLNNLASTHRTKPTEYCFDGVWPEEFPRRHARDELHSDHGAVRFDRRSGCLTTPTSEAAVVPL